MSISPYIALENEYKNAWMQNKFLKELKKIYKGYFISTQKNSEKNRW